MLEPNEAAILAMVFCTPNFSCAEIASGIDAALLRETNAKVKTGQTVLK